jgi:hypothetical protein
MKSKSLAKMSTASYRRPQAGSCGSLRSSEARAHPVRTRQGWRRFRSLDTIMERKLKTKKQRNTLKAILLVLGCLAFLPQMQALSPPPDGCYPNFTTAEGCNALQNLTAGAGNTGVGWYALFGTSTGNFNTGIGAGALVLNNSDSNTAVGVAALLLNTAGTGNSALGTAALVNNDNGTNNTALGAFALQTNTNGSNNTALGNAALQNSTGDFITAVGANAGTDPGIVTNNVYIGDPGFAGDENVISIGGIAASGTPYVNCYIGGIAPQSQATDGVTVCEVSVRLADGRLGIDCTHPSNPGSVPDSAPLRRSGPQEPHARTAMTNGRVGQVEKLEAAVAEQQKQIETLTAQLKEQAAQFTAQLKEQAAQIQKVSAQLELRKPARRVVVNKK